MTALEIREDDIVLDATLGGAGHAKEIAARLGERGTLVGIDADAAAIARARDALSGAAADTVFIHGNFRHLGKLLPEQGVTSLTKALFDLGWSSFQLADGRGFSFLSDEPLLMTYEDRPGERTLTAAQAVNEWEEASLADVIFGWGEDRYARRIARAIVERRAEKPFETARELAEVIAAAVPPVARFGKLHPATRTFQALRIAVNDEMGALKEGIAAAWEMLLSGGRLAVISFHSIEDREVKRLLVGFEERGEGERLTKKPIVPSEEECRENPRARSAKLRVIEKL